MFRTRRTRRPLNFSNPITWHKSSFASWPSTRGIASPSLPNCRRRIDAHQPKPTFDMPSLQNQNQRHVVVIGGGFAGYNLVRKLARDRRYVITLVDQNNFNY